MTTRIASAPKAAPQIAVRARDAQPAAPATNAPKAAEAPKEDPGAMGKMGEFLAKTGITDAVSKAINAKGSDEVIAAITGGVAQLAIERTGVKDLDKQLHDDYAGTIKKYVSNETAQKALLAVGDVLGDKVASNVISAGIGAITGTTVELLKDEKFRTMYKADPKGFGLELAKRGGKNFGVALLAAFATAKAEESMPWILKFLKSLFGKK